MGKDFTEIMDIEEIAQQAQAGIDISEHFTGQFQSKQNIDVALPIELLKSIDLECQRQDVTRQDWIDAVCAEKVRETQANLS